MLATNIKGGYTITHTLLLIYYAQNVPSDKRLQIASVHPSVHHHCDQQPANHLRVLV